MKLKFLYLCCIPTLGAADFEVRDETAFSKCVASEARIQKLAGEMKFTEGPTWLGGKDGHLVFSDIPSNELKKWTAKEGVTRFRQPSQNTNGNTIDLDGRLVSAEHTARRISRTGDDGRVETVVERYEGKKFNSPNDVVVKSDGTMWFTDPPYGLPKGEAKELDGHYVFRHDPKSGRTSLVARDQEMPNGLAFSPDEAKLFVADSGKPHQIWSYEVKPDGDLANGRVFCVIDKGGPDGIRVDVESRVWSSAGDGVHIFSPDGILVGKVLCPESPANLCFGGAEGKTLFLTARTSLYSIPVRVAGARAAKR
ncbi:MAG: SMP-30/gluconolactonase/LRE family protein [Verrucomicrobiales bacterium]